VAPTLKLITAAVAVWNCLPPVTKREDIRQVCATLLGVRHVHERLCGGPCLQRGAITSVRPLPFTYPHPCIVYVDVYRAHAARRSARTRSWPSSYIDPPLLIVADNEVCNAAICTAASTTTSTTPVNNGGVANSTADAIVFFDPSGTDRASASADQLQITGSGGGSSVQPPSSMDHPPPPLRTQRSDPGPTDRTTVTLYDRDTDDAPP